MNKSFTESVRENIYKGNIMLNWQIIPGSDDKIDEVYCTACKVVTKLKTESFIVVVNNKTQNSIQYK